MHNKQSVYQKNVVDHMEELELELCEELSEEEMMMVRGGMINLYDEGRKVRKVIVEGVQGQEVFGLRVEL